MGYGESGKSGATGDHATANCFVASACYGKHSDITDSLRDWRDKTLASNQKFNILFIRIYYAALGRPGGWLLERFPFLKPFARKIILLFAKLNNINIRHTATKDYKNSYWSSNH